MCPEYSVIRHNMRYCDANREPEMHFSYRHSSGGGGGKSEIDFRRKIRKSLGVQFIYLERTYAPSIASIQMHIFSRTIYVQSRFHLFEFCI